MEYHLVPNETKPSNADLNHIPILETPIRMPSNALRGSRHDHCPTAQGPASRGKRDELLTRPYHLRRARRLSHVAVDRGLQVQSLRIRHQLRRDQVRSRRAKVIKGLGVAHLVPGYVDGVKVARRDVVADCVAEHVVQCVVLTDVVSILANHDAQLSLVVQQLLRVWVDLDVVQWSSQTIGRSSKDDGFLRRRKLSCLSALPSGSLERVLTFVSLA